MTRSSSPTASTSTASDRSSPPGVLPSSRTNMPPPATTNFSPIPTNSRPRRPLSPSSLRDVDIPLDPERAFAARGKFPAPPTGHELMALFPPAPPLMQPGPTSGFFEREERKFFAQAGKEIVRLRLEIDTLSHPGSVGGATSSSVPTPSALTPTSGPGVPSPTHRHRHPRAPSLPAHPHHPHPHPHPHERAPPTVANLPPPPPPPHATSPRTHAPPPFPLPPAAASPQGPGVPAHPGYPINRPPPTPVEHERAAGGGVGVGGGGGGGEAMVVEDDDDEAWRRPTPHNARRRAGKHTRRVIVK
ncbi:hypothetical protein C8Q76DRAFT_764205 [Earliella scabrosa]|nr:hypothetical protein C8Q76DRAFT_764205 [Earliella scabrosa]